MSLVVAAAPLPGSAVGFGATRDDRVIPVSGVTVQQMTIRYDRLDRRVVYLRPTSGGTAPAPLFVLLHYHGGTPEKMANLTRAARLVAQYGAWVALPEAENGSWDFSAADRRHIDDSGFLARLIDDMAAAFPVDPQRVYMVGFSQGGFMTERFLCDHPERIAAAGWSSAELIDTQAAVCRPGYATPLMTFHGTADPVVPYQGQPGVASAPNTAAFFAGLNGCAAMPVDTALPDIANDGTTVSLARYGSCGSAAPVAFYTINGGGHTWPGSPYPAGRLGATTQDIDATLLFYGFAVQYRR